jgi:hypothetical protein
VQIIRSVQNHKLEQLKEQLDKENKEDDIDLGN